MYAALDIAKYAVNKCINDNCPISNLQLQKILYYIQRDFLRNGGPAFADAIEAWKFGPVVPSVYYYFCGAGANKLTIARKPNHDIDYGIELIKSIIETKRELMPWDLVAETHKANGAWAKTYDNGKGNKKIIPIDLIKECG